MNLEFLHERPGAQSKERPILFVHGKWQGAWCWREHFMPYFAQKGYDVYAINLRGHGGSEGRKKLRWHSIADYVEDVGWAVKQIEEVPIIVGHSMGAFITQKYLETNQIPAAVLLTPVPYFGLWKPTWDLFRRRPWLVIKAVGTMSLYPVVDPLEIARENLFSREMADNEVKEYQEQMQDESFRAYIDELGLNLAHPNRIQTPMLVIGAENDALIPKETVQSTARAYHTEAIFLPDTAHNVMLESTWQFAADHVLNWLNGRGM